MFINILINAVDSLDGKPGEIGIKSELKGEKVIVRICDSGKGIVEDDIDKIFEPFFTTKEIGKGTGLGLWVSYGIVRSFQGDIKVESKEGKGATFTVTLPAKGM